VRGEAEARRAEEENALHIALEQLAEARDNAHRDAEEGARSKSSQEKAVFVQEADQRLAASEQTLLESRTAHERSREALEENRVALEECRRMLDESRARENVVIAQVRIVEGERDAAQQATREATLHMQATRLEADRAEVSVREAGNVGHALRAATEAKAELLLKVAEMAGEMRGLVEDAAAARLQAREAEARAERVEALLRSEMLQVEELLEEEVARADTAAAALRREHETMRGERDRALAQNRNLSSENVKLQAGATLLAQELEQLAASVSRSIDSPGRHLVSGDIHASAMHTSRAY